LADHCVSTGLGYTLAVWEVETKIPGRLSPCA
jgi:hypothetical protein